MIVHSGASLHGHEFSNQQTDQPPTRFFPFLSSVLRSSSDTEPISRHTTPVPDPVDTLPARPVSVEPAHNPRSSLATRRRTTSDIAHTVRFREPHSDLVVQSNVPSEDEESLVGSEVSDQTDASIRLKRRKRGPRKSAKFALAFPAPQLRTKQRAFFQIRPRVLLQLQELGEKRAIPAFDIMPSSLIAGTLIIPALAKQFPRMFCAKPHLGQNDLLLVRSEDYGPPHSHHHHLLHHSHHDNTDNNNNNNNNNNNSSSRDCNDLDHNDILAVVSTTSDDDYVEIVFQDGSTWTTSRMANGSYEFNHVNDQGETVKARWVKRSLISPRASWGSANTASTTPSSPTSPPPPDSRWTFSIIDPSTRRHPIQGVLNSTSLEIFDTYNTMSTSSGIYPPTRLFGSDMSGISEEDATSITDERATLEVTEYNKTLMLATATWISLRQRGWPASATPKIPRVVSQRVSSGLSRGTSIDMVNSGMTNSQISSTNPSDALAAARNPGAGRIRRAVSSGGEFMRRRREAAAAAAAASAASSIAEREPDEKHGGELEVSEEETTTCRFRVRRLAHRIFHHSENRRVS